MIPCEIKSSILQGHFFCLIASLPLSSHLLAVSCFLIRSYIFWNKDCISCLHSTTHKSITYHNINKHFHTLKSFHSALFLTATLFIFPITRTTTSAGEATGDLWTESWPGWQLNGDAAQHHWRHSWNAPVMQGDKNKLDRMGLTLCCFPEQQREDLEQSIPIPRSLKCQEKQWDQGWIQPLALSTEHSFLPCLPQFESSSLEEKAKNWSVKPGQSCPV